MEHIITNGFASDPESSSQLIEVEKVIQELQKTFEQIKTNGCKEIFIKVELQHVPETVKTRSL